MFGQEEHEIIGFNILKERRRKNLTQEALANLADISRPRLSAIERGSTTLTLETLMRIASVLGVDYRLLLK